MNKYGTIIGGLLAAVVGLWYGYNEYQKAFGKDAGRNYLTTITGGKFADGTVRTPEISKLAGMTDDVYKGSPMDYLKYKFLGMDANNNYVGSAWVIPFWAGLVGYLAGPIAKMVTHKGQRILRPISKIGKGAMIMSAAGALALPGSPELANPNPVGVMTMGQVAYPRSETRVSKLL